ncbi:MAG: hypothetical protein U1E84_12035 [Rhodoferax sp.]
MRRLIRLRTPAHHGTRVCAWVLVCVALWTAFMAPWVHAGHARNAAADGLMAICSSASPGGVSASNDEAPTFAQYQSDHCRFCLQTTDPKTPPPTAHIPNAGVAHTLGVLTAGGQGPVPVAVLTRAAPRGPPLLHTS